MSITRSILAISDAYRALLIEREAATVSRMTDAYLQVRAELLTQLDQLLADMERAEANGEAISLSWLFRQRRYHDLLRQVEAQIDDLMPGYERLIAADQRAAIATAVEAFEQLTLFQLPPQPMVRAQFTRLPTSALEHLVGVTVDGSPLADLLAELGPDAAKRVRDELIRGVGTGRHPRVTARKITEALDGNHSRARSIARTETIRAYTNSSREMFQQNEDVVDGWIWHSALDTRTCAYCWAMHGTFHTTDEEMARHVNCRCALLPKTKTWAELGFVGIPETSIEIPRGSALFDALPDSDKVQILGPAKFAAYKSGVIDLDDLIGQRQDAKWGLVGWERSLKEAIGARRAAEFRLAADD